MPCTVRLVLGWSLVLGRQLVLGRRLVLGRAACARAACTRAQLCSGSLCSGGLCSGTLVLGRQLLCAIAVAAESSSTLHVIALSGTLHVARYTLTYQCISCTSRVSCATHVELPFEGSSAEAVRRHRGRSGLWLWRKSDRNHWRTRPLTKLNKA